MKTTICNFCQTEAAADTMTTRLFNAAIPGSGVERDMQPVTTCNDELACRKRQAQFYSHDAEKLEAMVS